MSEQTSPNPAQPTGTQTASETEIATIFPESQPKETVVEEKPTKQKAGEQSVAAETVVTPEAKPASTGLSQADIVEILQKAGVGQPAPVPTVVAPVAEMTPEQFEKTFNVFNPNEELVKRLTDESPAVRIKAMQEYRDGVVRQVMTMAEYRIKQHMDNLRTSDITPIQTYVSERRAQEFHDEFYDKNPDLKPYEIIVDAVATKLQSNGFTANSRDEIIKRFAEDSRTAVKELLAKGGTQPSVGGNGATAQPKRQMSTLSSGGQGGVSKPTTAGGKYDGLPSGVAAGLSAFD